MVNDAFLRTVRFLLSNWGGGDGRLVTIGWAIASIRREPETGAGLSVFVQGRCTWQKGPLWNFVNLVYSGVRKRLSGRSDPLFFESMC